LISRSPQWFFLPAFCASFRWLEFMRLGLAISLPPYLSTLKEPRDDLELMRVLQARAPPSKPNGEPALRAPHYGTGLQTFDCCAFSRLRTKRIEAAISVAS
jgi:hypothetical protein